MRLSWRARRRWSLVVLLVGLPVYVVAAVTIMSALDRPPLVISPYDAELFGHWWYEGPEFLDRFVRQAYQDRKTFELITPEQYLRRHPTNQIATPAASSWGEEGYYRVAEE